MLEINESSIFKLKSSLTIKDILDESFFILDSETGKQYDLTEMEYKIITLLSEKTKFIDIVNIIAKEYDEKIDIIKTELKKYIEEMINEGLLIG